MLSPVDIDRPFAQRPAGDLAERLWDLTEHHAGACLPYGNVLRTMWPKAKRGGDGANVPFVPVSLFKERELASVPDNRIVSWLTSSGTTGQRPSRIALDDETAQLQAKALGRLHADFFGPERRPMLIVDAPSTLKRGGAFSARAAGILGFSRFGRSPVFVLDDDMRVDVAALRAFAQQHAGQPILVFGFTFMVWRHLVQALPEPVDLGPRAILVHGGGWKKLSDEAVDADRFREGVRQALGIRHVHNYYGMVEQVGSIYMECNQGFLHVPAFGDVIVRDPGSLQPLAHGATGLLQVLSELPRSYPGHSLLTEDLGRIVGQGACPCGRHGKRVTILGRLPKAELRGCSDTHAATVDPRTGGP